MADQASVVTQYENELKVSDEKVHAHMNKCIDKADRVPELVTQMKKYFPKGRPKRGSSIGINNAPLAHDKDIDEIKKDVNHSLEK